jgi:hypothetical protein
MTAPFVLPFEDSNSVKPVVAPLRAQLKRFLEHCDRNGELGYAAFEQRPW